MPLRRRTLLHRSMAGYSVKIFTCQSFKASMTQTHGRSRDREAASHRRYKFSLVENLDNLLVSSSSKVPRLSKYKHWKDRKIAIGGLQIFVRRNSDNSVISFFVTCSVKIPTSRSFRDSATIRKYGYWKIEGCNSLEIACFEIPTVLWKYKYRSTSKFEDLEKRTMSKNTWTIRMQLMLVMKAIAQNVQTAYRFEA